MCAHPCEFFFQAEDGIRDLVRSRGLGDVYKRQVHTRLENPAALYRHAFRTLDATLVAPRLRRYRPRIVVMDAHMRDYITSRYRGGYRDLVPIPCLLYTSDAADERSSVDLGGRRIIKKKKTDKATGRHPTIEHLHK